MSQSSLGRGVRYRPPSYRSLATKFSAFTLALVSWVTLMFLAYDVRQGSLGMSKGVVVCLLWVLVVGAISRFTIRQLVRPMAGLLEAIDQVQQGRLEPVAISPTNDEVELLGHRFNEMIASLVQSRREMQEQRELLEDRIEQRTQELRDAMQRAIAANEAKGDFLAHMSHELRTPMNGILGMLELVLDSRLTTEQREQLEVSRRCAYSLLALLNNILDLSKIEAGRIEPEQIPFDLTSLVEESVKTFEARAKQKGIALLSDIDRAVPRHMIGDPLRLRQIINNLLGNAVKFTEQGFVKLRLDLRDEDRQSSLIRLMVSDSGPGIPASKLEQVFDKFTQGDNSVSRRYGGSGLGLTITRKLVECFGGSIKVESEVGRGSTFTVEMSMLRDQSSDSLEALRYQVGPADVRRRILVVEDNAVNQKVVSAILRKNGYQPVVASDGREALDLLSRQSVALVLMDVQMPNIDGLEATRLIRQRPGLASLPIIAMTAHAMAGDRERCLAAGMNDYLSKPVQPANLIAFVEQYLGHAQPTPIRAQAASA